MAYFPNGTSGDKYVEKWCFRCQHWKDLGDDRGDGCPIWDAHMLNNYDQCKTKCIKDILAIFIPMTKDKLFADKCNMFLEEEGEILGQEHLNFNKE